MSVTAGGNAVAVARFASVISIRAVGRKLLTRAVGRENRAVGRRDCGHGPWVCLFINGMGGDIVIGTRVYFAGFESLSDSVVFSMLEFFLTGEVGILLVAGDVVG